GRVECVPQEDGDGREGRPTASVSGTARPDARCRSESPPTAESSYVGPRSLDYPASSLNNRSPSRVSSSSESAPPHVLVIEDHRDSREGLRELLEGWGHVVELADNGLDGIERALKQSPRIALIDIGLPDLDGYEVAARLRR